MDSSLLYYNMYYSKNRTPAIITMPTKTVIERLFVQIEIKTVGMMTTNTGQSTDNRDSS